MLNMKDFPFNSFTIFSTKRKIKNPIPDTLQPKGHLPHNVRYGRTLSTIRKSPIYFDMYKNETVMRRCPVVSFITQDAQSKFEENQSLKNDQFQIDSNDVEHWIRFHLSTKFSPK